MDSSKPIAEILEKNTSTNKPPTDEDNTRFVPLWAIRRHVLLSRLIRRRLKPQKMSDEETPIESNG